MFDDGTVRCDAFDEIAARVVGVLRGAVRAVGACDDALVIVVDVARVVVAGGVGDGGNRCGDGRGQDNAKNGSGVQRVGRTAQGIGAAPLATTGNARIVKDRADGDAVRGNVRACVAQLPIF